MLGNGWKMISLSFCYQIRSQKWGRANGAFGELQVQPTQARTPHMAASGRALGDRTVPLSCPFFSLHPLQLHPNTYPLASPVYTGVCWETERVRMSRLPAPVRSTRLPRGGRWARGRTAWWPAVGVRPVWPYSIPVRPAVEGVGDPYGGSEWES